MKGDIWQEDVWEKFVDVLRTANQLAKDYDFAKREAIKWNDEAVKLREQVEELQKALEEIRNTVWSEYVPASLSAKVNQLVNHALERSKT